MNGLSRTSEAIDGNYVDCRRHLAYRANSMALSPISSYERQQLTECPATPARVLNLCLLSAGIKKETAIWLLLHPLAIGELATKGLLQRMVSHAIHMLEPATHMSLESCRERYQSWTANWKAGERSYTQTLDLLYDVAWHLGELATMPAEKTTLNNAALLRALPSVLRAALNAITFDEDPYKSHSDIVASLAGLGDPHLGLILDYGPNHRNRVSALAGYVRGVHLDMLRDAVDSLGSPDAEVRKPCPHLQPSVVRSLETARAEETE